MHYPGAVLDPDTGALISDAEVAETGYTLRPGHGRTSPPGWWCAASKMPATRTRCSRCGGITRFSPTPTLPTAEADITHRRHAIIETTFADLIDGPLAHIPSGLFAANCAWLACAVIAHNLLRAAGTLAGGDHAVARGATLRRGPGHRARPLRRPARKPTDLHLPAHWPWATQWQTLWHNIIGYSPQLRRLTHRPASVHPAIQGPTQGTQRKAGPGQQITHAHSPTIKIT